MEERKDCTLNQFHPNFFKKDESGKEWKMESECKKCTFLTSGLIKEWMMGLNVNSSEVKGRKVVRRVTLLPWLRNFLRKRINSWDRGREREKDRKRMKILVCLKKCYEKNQEVKWEWKCVFKWIVFSYITISFLSPSLFCLSLFLLFYF